MAINPVIPMVYKVDWFQATETQNIEGSVDLFRSKFWLFLTEELGYKIDDFEEINSRYFYNTGLTLGRYLNIYYDNDLKEISSYSPRNVLFQFTGQGSTDLALKLSDYYKSTNFSNIWYEFFKIVCNLDLKVTRLDIALDDYNGVLNFDKMERKLKRREFKSSKRSYNIVKDKHTDGSTKGQTIYLGARKRHQDGYIVRFYDKYAEYKSKGAIVPTVVENIITDEGSHKWQRYEMEIHGSACMNFISKILGGYSFGQLYKGLMRNAIEFLKVSKSNKNKARWDVVDWWLDFLENAEKCSLAEPERDLDLGRLLRWIRVSVVPSLHLLDEIGSEKNFDIYGLIKVCEVGRYSKKQERLKNTALSMSQDEIDKFIDLFKKGDYS